METTMENEVEVGFTWRILLGGSVDLLSPLGNRLYGGMQQGLLLLLPCSSGNTRQGLQACNLRVVPLGFEILVRDSGGLHWLI